MGFKEASGVPQNSVLGIYRLKALEKIHSTCNFKFKVQVNGGERENI
jgi:hypothetical protein